METVFQHPDMLGPITFGKKEEEIFLGRDFTQKVDYSESTATEIRLRGQAYHPGELPSG